MTRQCIPLILQACTLFSGDAPSPDKLIAIMKDREAAITSVSVRIRALYGLRQPLPDRSLAPMVYTNDLYEVIEESSGRRRVLKVTQVPLIDSPEKKVDRQELFVFDGKTTRSITSSLTEPEMGRVVPNIQIHMPFWASLFPVITKFSTTPLSRFLEKNLSALTQYRLVSIGRKEMLEVEIKIPRPNDPSSLQRCKLVLDIQAGFAPASVEIWDQPDDDPRIRFSYEMTNHIEAAPGLWLPSHVRFRGWGVVDGKAKRDVAQEVIADFEDWRVNPALDPNTFVLSFKLVSQIAKVIFLIFLRL